MKETMKKPFLTLNVKLQKKQTIKYKIVNKNFLKILEFPEEELIEKTKASRKPLSTKPIRKRNVQLNKKANILKKTLRKRKVLKAIEKAIKSYENFPLNQIEYVQLLWDAIDEIEVEIKHLIPIINCSTHNNLMRCLYTILIQNNKNLIKLIEYEVEPISKSHFETICLNLMDNVLTCNRILLGCCYAQNSYQKVNKPLENLIVLVQHFEMIVAFVSKAILQSEGCVENYIPSGYIIRHLKCSLCDAVVSLAGCYCTNWALDTLSTKQSRIFSNPLEDGPATSSNYCIMSWDAALCYLRNMPPPVEDIPALKFTNDNKPKYTETALTIRDIHERRTPKLRKRKAVDTIDEVWLKTKITGILDGLREPQEKPDCKRKAGNDAWLINELNDILDRIPPRKSKRVNLKRKTQGLLEDVYRLHKLGNLLNSKSKSNLSLDELLDQADGSSRESRSNYSRSTYSRSTYSRSGYSTESEYY